MIKIFGLQRTGTNYLQELCKKNFPDKITIVHDFGWKHGPIAYTPLHWVEESARKKAEDKEIDCLVIIKNPYTWIESIKKWWPKEYGYELSIEEYIEVYNVRYSSYLYYLRHEKPVIFYRRVQLIRYEDLLTNLHGTMNTIYPTEKVRDVNNVPLSAKFTKERKVHYLSPKPNDRVTKAVDWEIIKSFGYHPIIQ